MEVLNRLTRITLSKSSNSLIAGDIFGRIHKFNLDLELIQSSGDTGYSFPINCIATTDKFIFTKNSMGGITKWCLFTLKPIDIIDHFYLRNEDYIWTDEEPSPTSSRGIDIIDNKLYFSNGYGQTVIIDINSFEVLNIHKQISENSLLDSICSEKSNIHVVGDKHGMVYIGDLEKNEFPIKLQIDDAGIHCIKYDKLHNRFWATQDVGESENRYKSNGIVMFNTDGTNVKQIPFTNDDVEELVFNNTYTRAYIAGFDGYVYVFDNTTVEPKLMNILGPLPYHVINLIYFSDQHIYALLQSGEVLRFNETGKITKETNFIRTCIRDIKPHPENNRVLYCAKDDSIDIISFELNKFSTVAINRVSTHMHTFGMLKCVRPLKDGSYIAISRGKKIFRSDKKGNLIWYLDTIGYPRDIQINGDETKVLLGTEFGSVVELRIEDGKRLDSFDFDENPVFIVGYTKDNRRVIGFKDGELHVYLADSKELVGKMMLIEGVGFPKKWLGEKNGFYYVVGSFGLLELDLNNYLINKQWTELMWNTKEDAAILDNHVYMTSYGYQLGSFDFESCEIIDLIEDLNDYPKSIYGYKDSNDTKLLFVGGRSNYLNTYKIIDGKPHKVRETYLLD
ncbi:WD40 repeat domain-containing protein [Bacillus cereus]|uniref:WD40 repeat domain-containing protein n=1 Tax=Bacillus cereus TaxID=1396 RepID=UPI001E596948|nr:WD40 repeat domain-containing protein [Bacillus cereus]